MSLRNAAGLEVASLAPAMHLPLHEWTHVAVLWRPGALVALYNGRVVEEKLGAAASLSAPLPAASQLPLRAGQAPGSVADVRWLAQDAAQPAPLRLSRMREAAKERFAARALGRSAAAWRSVLPRPILLARANVVASPAEVPNANYVSYAVSLSVC